ncbi:APC family permease [Natronocalculus amylovorans]|uniref:APC family permease n=1 Tax=Natronocalculus amylovorans TaxID=2917812 RepID=A0AAE3FZS6_9EURY|nr:APC family permease [Natronocalculus amylovorans]MCL9818028.1 APC family permease [Natronocalculus amylovorans]
MATGLKRDLGLPSVTAIAIGAMVGSGIFILPGIAFATAGPAVVIAYLIAGLLVLPAALSASEMATAMPEDGGSYVYVERGMGPLLGTIAGIGNWFMLSFKGSLALVGGVPYLVYIAPDLAEYIIFIALGLALMFTLLNIVSTKSTGSLQLAIVGIMIAAMVWFILGGYGSIIPRQTTGSFDIASEGILAATGLVFVSYAGVIKIAAVAEEVKDPGKTIPRAMIGSLLFTTALYVLIVYVAIGVVDFNAVLPESGEGAIMAFAAEEALGTFGVIAVVIAALMALASTANAGLLSASRFPFAMARDGLAPERFEAIHDKYNTPVLSIALTGGAMMVMIATLPIEDVAKLGSAFQILVFILVNLALIGFREGAVGDYDPEFVAPFYPWVQIIGMGGGLILLTQMGLIPLLGAAGISVAAALYYVVYVRDSIEREGAAREAIRRNIGDDAVKQTRELFESDSSYKVLVATTEQTSTGAKRDMVRVGSDMGRLRSTAVSVVEFLDIPHQIFAENHAKVQQTGTLEWLADIADDAPEWMPTDPEASALRTSGGVDTVEIASNTAVSYQRIDSEDHKRAIVDVATYRNYDLLLLERRADEFHRRLFGSPIEWILENTPTDVLLVEDRGFNGADEIAVVATRGAYDPLKILIADAVAEETGAEINLLQAIGKNAPETQRETLEAYHNELAALCTVPVRSTIIETDNEISGLARFAQPADLLITGVDQKGLRGRIFGRPSDQLVDSVESTAIMVQTHDGRKRGGVIKRLLMDHLFS